MHEAYKQYVSTCEIHGHTIDEALHNEHAATMKKAWSTFYHGMFLNKLNSTAAKGTVMTALNGYKNQLGGKNLVFNDMDEELQAKVNSVTKTAGTTKAVKSHEATSSQS